MEKLPLTSRQSEILEYLERFTAEHGYPPTVREICAATGLKSPRSASQHLEALERKGYIERGREKSRAIRFLHRPAAASESEAGDVVRLRVKGMVSAGAPATVTEVPESGYAVDRRLVGGDNCYLLKVQGRSMIEAHIAEGDYLVVDPDAETASGDIVVAEVDGETTVKRYASEQGRGILAPENSDMAAIDISAPGRSTRILGKVVGLIRRMG